MSATMKLIHTRPSLSSLFSVERGGLRLDGTPDALKEEPGFISGTYDELISAAEYKSRKEELQNIRPDLVELLWISEDECILDMLIDPNHPFYMEGNIYFNPFTLTYTPSYTFDTLENLKSNYERQTSNLADFVEDREYRATIGESLEQRVYVDGVDITSSIDWFRDI